VKIALVQQQATSDIEDNLTRAQSAFIKAAQNGAQLIAFAELAFLPFLPQRPAAPDSIKLGETIPGPTTRIFSDLAKEHHVVAVINLFERCGERTYDSSPVIDADGSILGVVRMAHIMEGQGFFEKGYYTPAEKPISVFQSQAGRVGVAICYDRHFPEYMRQLGLLGPDIVIIPRQE
jgi:N-carbamoylputrescine amidase